MPRTRGIPAYGLHRPSGQARVRIDGVDHYLGPHGSEESKREYERLVRKLITARAAQEVRARVEVAADLTVSELVASYVQHAKAYYVKDGRQTSEFGVIALTLRPVREQYGHELVTAFGPLKLLALRDRWAAEGIVREQVNHRIERVRRMFKWGVSRQLVPPDVLTALKTVEGLRKGRCAAKEGRKVRPAPDADVEAVRPFVSRQVWAMIELQRLTGMRPEEATLMRTIDIDMTGEPWTYTPGSHKTEHHGRERIIPLGPRAREVLKPWLRLNVTEYLFQPREAMEERAVERRKARRTKVQPSQQCRRAKRPRRRPGDRYTTGSYRQAIAKACDRAFPHPTLAGIPDEHLADDQRGELEAWRKARRWKPNQLRHSAATLLRREFGLDVAKAVLGHSSVAPTQIYAEQDLEAARRAMEKLG